MIDLYEQLITAIREEASHYPGDDEHEDRCGSDEAVCMKANIHMEWSTNGVIGSVSASPERLAKFCVEQIAIWLHKKTGEGSEPPVDPS